MKFSIRGLFSFELSLVLPRLFWQKAPAATAVYELERFHIAGFQFHEGPELIEDLQVGAELHLVREPENRHDARAVAIHFGAAHVGYVPRECNRTIAQLLDQGAPLFCLITDVDPVADPWHAVEVAIRVVTDGPPIEAATGKKPALFDDL
jgi:hypothetical protein